MRYTETEVELPCTGPLLTCPQKPGMWEAEAEAEDSGSRQESGVGLQETTHHCLRRSMLLNSGARAGARDPSPTV